jgi:arylsulfatase A-like enzyme
MNAASLFIVLAFAKMSVLWGRSIEWTAATAIAYVWQDVLVALLFGAVAWTVGKTRARLQVTWLVYWALVLYTALNIPIAIVLSTPLTWSMLRATSGTLADSILLYVTPSNALVVLLAVVIAGVLPRLTTRLPPHVVALARASAIVIIAIGPSAGQRVETSGLHRNASIALVTSALPRISASALAGDWTRTPFDARPHSIAEPGRFEPLETEDLSHLRGFAAGRNVVLVILESTGAQYLSLYGGAEDVTPNLDALARHAIVFETAYAAYPESIKGLFSILCSTYPAFDTTPQMYERAPCDSIASVLSRRGYRTALFHSGRFAYLGMESIVQGRGFDTLEDAGDISGRHQSSFGVDEPSTVARILSWLDGLPVDQRFFVTYAPIAGHHPYETPVPGPFPTGKEIGRYRNALRYADESFGTLLAGIRARGLEQNTMWVVLGDHGEAFGQHAGNYGHTFFLYDENVRVPFLIAAPGIVEPQRSRTTVSLVDTAPTILDVLGLPTAPTYQGQSALAAEPRMALFFTDYSLGLLGLRDGRWKYVYELESGRAKLFDLDEDPAESVNLASRHMSRVLSYQRTLHGWSAAQKQLIAP